MFQLRPETLYFLKDRLRRLGTILDRHGNMPDLILHDDRKEWLLLIEAVTSHGPINPKRHNELKTLFASAKPGLVYVTAFPSRSAMTKHLKSIAWETEVWCADSPDHLIHFDGERYQGPYKP